MSRHQKEELNATVSRTECDQLDGIARMRQLDRHDECVVYQGLLLLFQYFLGDEQDQPELADRNAADGEAHHIPLVEFVNLDHIDDQLQKYVSQNLQRREEN